MKYIKKITAYALAGLIGASVCSQPLVAAAGEWEREGNIYRMADGTAISGAIARGVDVSHWKQSIDWNRVAADDVKFAMLGTTYKGDVDPYFAINAQGAYNAGIEIGAYLFSYAASVEAAEQEADFILNLIKDYPISYPVVFDAEDMNTLGSLSPSEVSDVINAFCRKIQAAGYYPMVYANEYWLKEKIDMSKVNYDVWVARYNVLHTYDSPAMWQATNAGSVDGINGNVDINFLYKDFGSVIPADTWRTIGGNTYYYKNHLMQKSAWINDGQGWYYMNAAGGPSKGFLTFPEGTYYLDEVSGKMATGFKQFGNVWNYFDPSGTMATGWRLVGDKWYYMDASGVMQSGFQDVGGVRYYLDASGAMQTGFQDINGQRYLFGQSGGMKTGWQQPDGNWYYFGEDGVMRTGLQVVDGAYYYLGADGKMLTGLQDINGQRYLFGQSGSMQTGWQNIDGKMYYFSETGALAVNMILDFNGMKYQAGADGVCVPAPEETAAQTAAEGLAADQTAQTVSEEQTAAQMTQPVSEGPAKGPASE